jgi:hypothetical protein
LFQSNVGYSAARRADEDKAMRELLIQQFPILELLQDSADPPLTSEAVGLLPETWSMCYESL